MGCSTERINQDEIERVSREWKEKELERLRPLEKVLEYKNEAVVDRYEDKLGLSRKDAEQLFVDTLTFLWLSSTAGAIAPPPRVDDGWHEFLMFTEDYAAFCQKYFGQMIHHCPRRRNDPPDNGESVQRTVASLREYAQREPEGNWDFTKQSFISKERKEPACSRCGSAPSCQSCISGPS